MTSEDPPRWETISDWWVSEVDGDPAYEQEVTPFLLELASPTGRILDVGCGDGRVMRALRRHGCEPFGVDVSQDLLRSAVAHGPVVRGRLPDLSFLDDSAFDAAVICLVLEHLPDERPLFAELARVVRPGGALTLVMNHPIYTAPESAPITDADGEVLWRPGRYFDTGHTDEPAGGGIVRFHHRPLGTLLTGIAAAGWDLVRLDERGVTESQVERYPMLAQQRHVPRLLGARWVRR